MLCSWTHAVIAALSFGCVNGNPHEPLAPVEVLDTRRDTSPFDKNALQGLRTDLIAAGLQQRDSDTQLYKTSGSLDLKWTDATFFS